MSFSYSQEIIHKVNEIKNNKLQQNSDSRAFPNQIRYFNATSSNINLQQQQQQQQQQQITYIKKAPKVSKKIYKSIEKLQFDENILNNLPDAPKDYNPLIDYKRFKDIAGFHIHNSPYADVFAHVDEHLILHISKGLLNQIHQTLKAYLLGHD